MDFSHLRPRLGWIEQVEIDWSPRCDDGTLSENSPLRRWAEQVLGAMDEAGRPMSLASIGDAKSQLAAAGFVDISQRTIQLPFNTWPDDPHLKDIGRWFNLGLCQGLAALSLAPLTRMRGWTSDQVTELVKDVRAEICSRRHHAYCEM